MTDAALRELARLYEGGMSVREVAAAKGYSYGATHTRLMRAQVSGLVTLRGRGGRSAPSQPVT